jgi:hypothetical protein
MPYIYYTTQYVKNDSFDYKKLLYIDANNKYIEHYIIELKLRRQYKNTTDFNTKRDIEDEIKISQQKQKYWSQHRNFKLKYVQDQLHALKRQYN